MLGMVDALFSGMDVDEFRWRMQELHARIDRLGRDIEALRADSRAGRIDAENIAQLRLLQLRVD
jgi:outer membrane murein-binding lipoprotein Lpp